MRKINNDVDVYVEIQLKIIEFFDLDELIVIRKEIIDNIIRDNKVIIYIKRYQMIYKYINLKNNKKVM